RPPRAARASRPRAAPPSITTRRRRPPAPPPRGRIGRFGLFGPSAIRLTSVETRELRADGDIGPQPPCERAAHTCVLEARRVAARVGAAAGERAAGCQHASHGNETGELRWRGAPAAAGACPDRPRVLTLRLVPPRTPSRRARPRSRPRRAPRAPPRPR